MDTSNDDLHPSHNFFTYIKVVSSGIVEGNRVARESHQSLTRKLTIFIILQYSWVWDPNLGRERVAIRKHTLKTTWPMGAPYHQGISRVFVFHYTMTPLGFCGDKKELFQVK